MTGDAKVIHRKWLAIRRRDSSFPFNFAFYLLLFNLKKTIRIGTLLDFLLSRATAPTTPFLAAPGPPIVSKFIVSSPILTALLPAVPG